MLYKIIDSLFWIYTLMLMARVLSSWFRELEEHPIIRFISFYTDPYLNLFRRLIPPLGPVDISPMIAFFALQFLEKIIKNIIYT
jgi:YggT family protein